MAETTYIEQAPIRLVTESTTIPYVSPETSFFIRIEGGSGFGDYYWILDPVTGSATFSNDQLTVSGSSTTQSIKFIESGSVLLSVYREGSEVVGTGYYIQSKTLSVELLLTEKEVQIVVEPSVKNYHLGEEYSLSDFHITHPNISNSVYNSIFSTKPELYVPYESLNDEGFYRFDVLSKATSENGYNKGVRYIKNNDGSWTVVGTAVSNDPSYYNLILSDTKLPDYITPERVYSFEPSVSMYPIYLEMIVYFSDGSSSTTSITSSHLVTFPKNACGLIIRFKVATEVDATFNLHFYELKGRVVDVFSEGSYAVSAKGGILVDNSSTHKKYSTSIKYRSAKFNILNDVEYEVVNNADPNLSEIIGLQYMYLPLTDVIFTIKAKPNCYFNDGWTDSNIYVPTTLNSRGCWDSWWVDENVDLCSGVGGPTPSTTGTLYFYIESTNPYTGTSENVPFHRLSAKYDEDGRLVEGQYWIKMPSAQTEFYFQFQTIYTISGNSYSNPYTDVYYSPSASGTDDEVILRDIEYEDALKFCYYAREEFFPDDQSSDRLLDGPYNDGTNQSWNSLFYRRYPTSSNVDLVRHLDRGDMLKSLRRVSHNIAYSNESRWPIDSNGGSTLIVSKPDQYLNTKSISVNDPDAVASYYAGYPPKLDWNSDIFNVHYPYDSETNKISFTHNTGLHSIVSNSDKYYMWFFCSNYKTGSGYHVAEDTAVSDFVSSVRDIPDYAWAAWAGIISTPYKYTPSNFNPRGFVDYKEALETLWNYAKFRQFDTSISFTTSVSSELDPDFVLNPCCNWALSKGITTGFHAPLSQGSYTVPDNVPIAPGDYVDRVEWAYMLSKFCQIYAW